MGMTKKSCLSFLTIVLLPLLVFAQKVEVGAGLGPTYYKGDLQPTFRVFNPSIGANIFARYNFTKTISFKANGFIGRVTGNDKKSGDPFLKERGFKFFTDIFDYNGQIEYNFLNFRTHNGRYEHHSTPYLFAGFGNFSPLSGSNYGIDTSSHRSFSGLSAFYTVPLGIGYKTILRGKWNFGIEFKTNFPINIPFGKLKTDNDYHLDLLTSKTSGPDPSNYTKKSHEPDEIFQYANTPQNDKYFYISFSVSYLFYKVHCPPGR